MEGCGRKMGRGEKEQQGEEQYHHHQVQDEQEQEQEGGGARRRGARRSFGGACLAPKDEGDWTSQSRERTNQWSATLCCWCWHWY